MKLICVPNHIPEGDNSIFVYQIAIYEISILMHPLCLMATTMALIICDWLWENMLLTHKDNYLEKRN